MGRRQRAAEREGRERVTVPPRRRTQRVGAEYVANLDCLAEAKQSRPVEPLPDEPVFIMPFGKFVRRDQRWREIPFEREIDDGRPVVML